MFELDWTVRIYFIILNGTKSRPEICFIGINSRLGAACCWRYNWTDNYWYHPKYKVKPFIFYLSMGSYITNAFQSIKSIGNTESKEANGL